LARAFRLQEIYIAFQPQGFLVSQNKWKQTT
jgi:hypothetical protein